jgi:hypothetical protein
VRVSRRIVLVAIFLDWFFCFFYYVAWLQPTTDIVERSCHPFGVWSSKEMQNAVGVVTLFAQYLIPIVVLVFCYGRILFVIRSKVTIVLIIDKHYSSIYAYSAHSHKLKALKCMTSFELGLL